MQIPILTYHSLDDAGSVISLSPKVFERHLQQLHDHGYRSCSLQQVVNALEQNQLFPEKSVVITFDDGYKNFFTEAFPLLQKYHFSAIVFVVTDRIGKTDHWLHQPPRFAQHEMLSWGQMRELARHGIEFGSHGRRHLDFTTLSEEIAEQEMRQSRQTLEDHLGKKVSFFAYPYGRFNKIHRELASLHFRGACSTRLSFVRASSDRFALERVDSYYLRHPAFFGWLFLPSFSQYLSIRRFGRALRSHLRPF